MLHTQTLKNSEILNILLINVRKGRRSAERQGGKPPHFTNNFGGEI